jgi:hypothetical protein
MYMNQRGHIDSGECIPFQMYIWCIHHVLPILAYNWSIHIHLIHIPKLELDFIASFQRDTACLHL